MKEPDLDAACPVCTALCTFEAMEWCLLSAETCPVMKRDAARFGGPNGAFEFLPAPGGRFGYITEDWGKDGQ